MLGRGTIGRGSGQMGFCGVEGGLGEGRGEIAAYVEETQHGA